MKVLVIDDDPGIVEVVSLCFEMRWPGAQVLCAEEGPQGIDLVRREDPDLVILDIGLSGMDGFEVCQEIRSFSSVPIIMLTVRSFEEDIIRGFEVGADDYITKPFSHINLLARVKAVLRRLYRSPRPGRKRVEIGDLAVDLGLRKVWLKGEMVTLNYTEWDLLFHLVNNLGTTVSNELLLQRVWGRDHLEARESLEIHIDQLREKLGDDPKHPKIIVADSGEGYRFSAPKKDLLGQTSPSA